MATIGYHASHEQFKPSELLEYVILAEESGFKAVNCSDHFNPWSERQGQSGYSFAWLGAAMHATTVPFGVVCTPGYRNHPAIVAQAAATLAEMFPDRFWVSLGSGEALNESITGMPWPSKPERNQKLKTNTHIIKELLKGKVVTHDGIVNAKLYTLPEKPPLLVGAAVTIETAAWMGTWADALITVSHPYEKLKEVVRAFQDNGGKGKPMYLKVQLSYAKTDATALDGAHEQWRTNVFSGPVLEGLSTVAQFDELGEHVSKEEMKKSVRISSDLKKHIEWIKGDISLGFEKIILHNVNREQELFIKDFGAHVLPFIK